MQFANGVGSHSSSSDMRIKVARTDSQCAKSRTGHISCALSVATSSTHRGCDKRAMRSCTQNLPTLCLELP